MSQNAASRMYKQHRGHRRVVSETHDKPFVIDSSAEGRLRASGKRISSYAIPEPDESREIIDLDEHIYLPYQMIYKIETVGKKHLSVHCKDFRTLYFSFRETDSSISQFMNSVRVYLPNRYEDSFAFRFASEYQKLVELSTNGWKIYNAKKELERILNNDPQWRISSLNQNYELCETYPRILAFPTDVTDDELISVREFRSRGRIPVLSWRHPENGATLTRCSQPRVGLSRTRCKEDEKLLQKIMLANQDASNPTKYLYLLDARPRANAMANQAVGAGYETTDRYKQTKLKFLQIPNIHVMRDSLRKLHDLCLPTSNSSTFLTQLESSHWFEYIQLILRSSLRIAKLLSSGTNVLIHCSDGWDRTSQVSLKKMV